jgi:YfiH family protein
MNRSEAIPGVAFGTAADGDGRLDRRARDRISAELGISTEWATVSQVHGADVVDARRPGHHGDADAIFTSVPGLPVTVATADCLPVVVAGTTSIGIAHAGWRGVASGVVPALVAAMRSAGDEPQVAEIGPHIGPCCYEVGPDVIEAIRGHTGTTRTGRLSADLAAAVTRQLDGIPVVGTSVCTKDDERFASYRRNGTALRQVTVAWLA